MSTYITRNYLPGTVDARANWLGTLVGGLASGDNAANLGVTPAQLDDLKAGLVWYDYALNHYMPYVRAYSKGLTELASEIDTDSTPNPLSLPVFAPPAPLATLPACESSVMTRAVAVVEGAIFPSPALTDALKTQLGLDPIAPPVAGSALITKFESAPGGVITLFFAQNGAKQVIVESRRGAETDFSMLDKVVGGQCPDSRENLVPGRPEAREYRIRYSDGVRAYGNYSPVFSVTTQA